MIHSPVMSSSSRYRDGHCGCLTLATICVETGSQKKQVWCCCASHYGICLLLWRTPVSTGNMLYSAFRSHRKGQANPWFSHPYSLRRTREWPEKLSPPHSSYTTTFAFHICPRTSHTLTKVFSAYSCSYLTLLHLNVIIYLPSTTFNLDFFGRLSETKPLEPTFVWLCHRTASILQPLLYLDSDSQFHIPFLP